MSLSSLKSVAGGLTAASLCILTGCNRVAPRAAEAATITTQQRAVPSLIVFITVDQLRADMLDRYRSDLHFGYARLMTGARFTNAFQDHAITETAPGHASTMSGRFPANTGIQSNTAGVVDRNYHLVTGLSNEVGASPMRFQGTTLTDWITAKYPGTHALSVSMKDRAAILPIGRSKQDVYWYSNNGSFMTSNYYRDTLPAWVSAFNVRRIPATYAGAAWRLSRDSSSYREPDDVRYENGGVNNVFPHLFPTDTLDAQKYIRSTPTMDSLTALFALEGLRQTGIGLSGHPDVLAVSFSATDVIGHTYGPDSREAHENEIRLDQTIGWFLDSLFKLRDSNTVMIALTGDHGISPIPELARERGQAKGNEGLRVTIRDEVDEVRAGLKQAGVAPSAFGYDGETVWLDRPAIIAAGQRPDVILDKFARTVRGVPGVARVDRISALRKANFDKDPIARRWSHQISKDSPVELVITLTRYSYWNTAVATHGSPYDQDASVPIIFYGPWAKPGTYTSFARTVDMGPTLAAIAGVVPTERVDGVVLTEAIRK
jgi:predicted AlkP superfamily pyrophosphatase or phosphodiesterase